MDNSQIDNQAAAADIAELFEQIRRHARENHQSMLELIAEYLIDDLPVSIGQTIKRYVEDSKPKVKPEDVTFEGLFASGRSDISERMEEIIYGPEPEEEQ